jgi:HemY protein
LLRLALVTLQLPERVRAYRLHRARNKAHNAVNQALTAYFEGRYNAAERAAAAALALNEWPAVSSVVAARSAHQLRSFQRRDDYLTQSESLAPDAKLLRLITRAELLLKEQRIIEALDVLRQVKKISSRSVAALLLELKAQTLSKNWDEVLALTDRLEKVNAIDKAYAEQARLSAYIGRVNRKAQDSHGLTAVWQSTPADLRTNRTLALTAAKYFIALGGNRQAQEIINNSLEVQWDSALLEMYSDCASANVMPLIERAETWLRDHPRDATLLLTLGKLCTQQALWGKAQSYLEASLALEPSQAAHVALAQLLEKIGKQDEALKHYRDSLVLDRRRWSIEDREVPVTYGSRRPPIASCPKRTEQPIRRSRFRKQLQAARAHPLHCKADRLQRRLRRNRHRRCKRIGIKFFVRQARLLVNERCPASTMTGAPQA